MSTTRQNGGRSIDACHAAVTPRAAQPHSFDGGRDDPHGFVGGVSSEASGAADDTVVGSGGSPDTSSAVTGCGRGLDCSDADDVDDALDPVPRGESRRGAGGVNSSGGEVSLADCSCSHGPASSPRSSACGANCNCAGIGASSFSSINST